MNKPFSEGKTLYYSYILILISLVASIFLSAKLWIGQRFFPALPLFDFLPKLKAPIDSIVLYAGALLIAFNIIYFFNKKLHIGLIIILFFIGIMDQTRIQPWYFHYFLLLLAFFNISEDKEKSKKQSVFLLKVIISISLFWNGLNKINTSYFSEVIPWFSKALAKEFYSPVFIISVLIPFIEICSPILLWKEKIRKFGIISIMIVQLFYILISGPLGYNTNLSMLPWHITIALLSFLLFQQHDSFKENISEIMEKVPVKIAIGAIAFLPFLNLFNLWDSYLSFNIYSGAGSSGTIYLSDESVKYLPKGIEKHFKNDKTPAIIDVKKWAVNELGVSVYPEKRAYLKVKNYFLKYAPDSSHIILSYRGKQTFFRNPDPVVE